MIRIAIPFLFLSLLTGATGCAAAGLSPEQEARLAESERYLDANRNLENVEATLLQLQRAEPDNPAVLLQLARSQLKLGWHSLPGTPGEVPEGWEEDRIARAEELLDHALAVDARHTDALILRAHLKYLRKDFNASLALLDRAQALGSDAPRLHGNRADVLWARALASMDPREPEAPLRSVIEAYEKVIRGPVDTSLEAGTALDLAELHKTLGEFDRAEQYLTQAIDASEGWSQANALHRRAMLRLYQRQDLDGALQDAERGRAIADFGLLREFHAWALLTKAGTLCSPECSSAADSYIRAMHETGAEMSSRVTSFGQLRGLRSGLRAMVHAGIVSSWKDPAMSMALAWAAMDAPPEEIAWLLDRGVNPDVAEPNIGNALHSSIFARKAPVALLLLERGADPTVPYRDGRTALAILESFERPDMDEVRDRLLADPDVIRTRIPLKEYSEYQPPVDLTLKNGDPPPPGSTIRYDGECHMGDEANVCLGFYVVVREPGVQRQWLIYVTVPRDHVAEFVAALVPAKIAE